MKNAWYQSQPIIKIRAEIPIKDQYFFITQKNKIKNHESVYFLDIVFQTILVFQLKKSPKIWHF